MTHFSLETRIELMHRKNVKKMNSGRSPRKRHMGKSPEDVILKCPCGVEIKKTMRRCYECKMALRKENNRKYRELAKSRKT